MILIVFLVLGACLVGYSTGQWHGYELGFVDGMVQGRPKLASTGVPFPAPAR